MGPGQINGIKMVSMLRVGSAGNHALRLLRERLEELTPGQRLPPERELAEELNVSRRALRQALEQLESEGLIWRRTGAGTVVADVSLRRAESVDALKALTSPTELMEARLALEPVIASLAAVHATSRDLDELRHYLESGAAAKDHRGWEKWDGELHRAIGRATHNTLIERLFDLLNAARAHTEWGRLRQASLSPERQSLYTRQHRAVLAAIVDRDPEAAAQRMRAHLTTVKGTLLEQWEGSAAAGRPADDELTEDER
jgi:DNA-binding FadR family transcriptional regulator